MDTLQYLKERWPMPPGQVSRYLPTEEDVEQESARLGRKAAEDNAPRLLTLVQLARERVGALEVWSWGDGIDVDHNPIPADKILILLPDDATDADLNSRKVWEICRDAGLPNFEVDADRVIDWKEASNYEINHIKSLAQRIG